MDYLLGVDVGGTKIAVGSMDRSGQVLETASIPSHAESGAELWSRLSDAAREVVSATGGAPRGIGIGSAGPINVETGTVSPVNIPVWRDFPLVDSFRREFNCQQVAMHGDAIALTNAEFRFGSGKGSRNMIGLVVSTGIGGGLVLDGELKTGSTGNAGYFGHSTIVVDGDLCPCGRRGCVEVYASGPHMVRQAKQLGWTGSGSDFAELAASARDGDETAVAALERGADALAVGIINVAATVDVSLAVVGGGVTRAGDVYMDRLRAALVRRSDGIEFLSGFELRVAQLDSSAGIIGAALAAF